MCGLRAVTCSTPSTSSPTVVWPRPSGFQSCTFCFPASYRLLTRSDAAEGCFTADGDGRFSARRFSSSFSAWPFARGRGGGTKAARRVAETTEADLQ